MLRSPTGSVNGVMRIVSAKLGAGFGVWRGNAAKHAKQRSVVELGERKSCAAVSEQWDVGQYASPLLCRGQLDAV